MEIEKAVEVVSQLAIGVDPATGEVFDEDSPYNNPLIIRALFTVLINQKNPRKQTKLSNAERQAKNLESGKPRNAGLAWTEELKTEVAALFKQGKSIKELALHFERTEGAVCSELEHQGVLVRDKMLVDKELALGEDSGLR